MSRTWAYVHSVVNVPMWCVLAAIASGAMMAACYWPLDLHFLAWIAQISSIGGGYFLSVLLVISSSAIAWRQGW